MPNYTKGALEALADAGINPEDVKGEIEGSGLNGRIVKSDVEDWLDFAADGTGEPDSVLDGAAPWDDEEPAEGELDAAEDDLEIDDQLEEAPDGFGHLESCIGWICGHYPEAEPTAKIGGMVEVQFEQALSLECARALTACAHLWGTVEVIDAWTIILGPVREDPDTGALLERRRIA